ncbi:DUF3261 domain-containing protein [Alteromonas sp. C1M14]|uniref:DUF3261 domain-containing protein n=1 Tax=Alteromonas sp. C1M14 TaxID=2841567 RepID=UPI001C08CAC5|nr:DUF3261 domain-containing protein [Alteromonas sp. C1M14]MBU2979667.1 DUF3261 domain-containing protein [Alteromonas sp. C1M14]
MQLSAPPASLWGTSRAELLTAYYNNTTKQAVVQTEFSEGRIVIAAFTLSGVPIMTMVWQPTVGTTAKTYFEVENLTPSFIIADLQLALWPEAVLNAHIEGTEVAVHLAGDSRAVTQAGKAVVHIKKSGDTIFISHIDKGYEISLETIK